MSQERSYYYKEVNTPASSRKARVERPREGRPTGQRREPALNPFYEDSDPVSERPTNADEDLDAVPELRPRPSSAIGDNSEQTSISASSLSKNLGLKGHELSALAGVRIPGLERVPSPHGTLSQPLPSMFSMANFWKNGAVIGGSKQLNAKSEGKGLWGTINLDADEWKKFFVKYGQDRPKVLRIPAINPLALQEMSRVTRRDFLNELSNVKIEVHVENFHHKEEKEVDFATMMIVALSVRREGERKLIGELAGLSPIAVMTNLGKFSWLPVLELGDIPSLSHAAARSICRKHHLNQTSGSVGRAVGDLIASILGSRNDNEKRKGEKVQTVFDGFLPEDHDMDDYTRMIQQSAESKGKGVQNVKDEQVHQIVERILVERDDDKDRGAQIGLVIAGLMRYIKDNKEKIDKKSKIANLVLETVLGGLTGVPVGGFVAAAVQPGLIRGVEWQRDKKIAKSNDLLVAVQDWYNNNILSPLHRDGGTLVIKGHVVKVQKELFEEWYDLMLTYNGLH